MFSLEQLYEMIAETYDSYKDAVLEYRNTGDKVARKQHEIDAAKAELYEQGLINGKNAEARDAQVMFLLNEEFEDFDVLKELEDISKRNMEKLGLEIEKLRALLRVEEVAASTGEGLRGERDK